MKRRTYPVPKSGLSPYVRHQKMPYDYSGMYNRNPGLRRPHENRTGVSTLTFVVDTSYLLEELHNDAR